MQISKNVNNDVSMNPPIICAFATNEMPFYRGIRQVENLFISLPALSESSKTCYFSTVLTLLLLTTVSVGHIYWRQNK